MARPPNLLDVATGFCFYCINASADRDSFAQFKTCLRCLTDRERSEFRDRDGEEHDICCFCAAQFDPTSSVSSLSEILSSSNPFSTPVTPSQILPLRRGPSIRSRASSLSLSQSQQQQQPEPAGDPVSDPPFNNDLLATAITVEDQARLQRFNTELAREGMLECPVCKQKWFDVKLREGVCTTCLNRDKERRPDEPLFYSADNDLDFGDVPPGLPQLS